MKKIAITSVILIAAVAAIFINTETQLDTAQLQVESQQDTEVDTGSSMDTFEYFLGGIGEQELAQLKENFSQFNSQRPAEQQIDPQLFQQYLNYKNYLQTLKSPADDSELTVEALIAIDAQLLAAQLQFFTPEQQQDLFAEENQLRELALRKLALHKQAETDQEFRLLWEQELQQLPEDEQQSYKNASLISELSKIDELDEQDKYLRRQALVGDELAERLTELDQQQANFKNQVKDYLSYREEILLNDHLDEDAKTLAIDALREQSFSANQQRRIKSLESIHDTQQGNS